MTDVEVDGRAVSVPDGSTLLDACGVAGVDVPTLCFGETLTPKNACRICVVELNGSRVLVPACSRAAEDASPAPAGRSDPITPRKPVVGSPAACIAQAVPAT